MEKKLDILDSFRTIGVAIMTRSTTEYITVLYRREQYDSIFQGPAACRRVSLNGS